MRFHVVNLGCKVNRVESDAFSARFIEQGWSFSALENADVIIVNTCTVTGEAEKKTRKAIRRALRKNEKALVFVTGCAAVIDPKSLLSIDKRVLIETDKTKIDTAIKTNSVMVIDPKTSFEQYDANCSERFSAYDASTMLRQGTGFVSRVGIKIQDGCDNACTFCIVHHARGRAWSRDKASILDEVRAYEDAGVHEIVLTGINIGSYRSEGGTLVDLLDTLIHETEKIRFRISSIEPRDVDLDLISLIAASRGRICRHFHLPLQSGSDKVLRAMARPYGADGFRELVDIIYEQIPQMSLSSDVIVGFPGESDEDFEASMDLIRYCRFSKVHIFPYSKRAGTPAASRIDHVDSQVKKERIERMNVLAELLRDQDFEERRGTFEDVLVEDDGFGTTESYHRIALPSSVNPGEILHLEL